MSTQRTAPSADSVSPTPWALGATVFIAGAAVMVVEILGTRVLAPVFGVSIFVWAALLSVTLCSLAIGYYAGGALADRFAVKRLLGMVLLAAGAMLSLAVLGASTLLRWGLSQGPRLGSLTCALALFGPVLVALGMVGPIAVRAVTTDVRRTGHGVGRTYAISTAGSLAGTLGVVFGLLPLLSTDVILVGTASTLMLTGLPWLAGGARVVAAGLALLPTLIPAALDTRERSARFQVLERVESQYGLLEAIEDTPRNMRLLRADHSVIGASAGGVGVFFYTHVLEALHLARPGATRMLQIGLGTGTLPEAMRLRGINTDVVEIDPSVRALAQAHFSYVPTGDVFIEDARTFIHRAPRQYDLVVHDTFTGGATPAHLLSREVFEDAKRLLRPKGILVVNVPGFSEGEHAAAGRLVARTLRTVFPVVRVFRDTPSAPSRPLANLLYFASTVPFDLSVPSDAVFEDDVCRAVLKNFEEWEVFEEVGPGEIITDARNPLTWKQVPIAEAHYAAMARLMPAEVWLPW